MQRLEPEKEETPTGDLIDGLVVALDMMVKFVGKKKYKKRIFLITDGEKKSECSPDDLGTIVQTIKDNDIKLNVIPMDFFGELEE